MAASLAIGHSPSRLQITGGDISTLGADFATLHLVTDLKLYYCAALTTIVHLSASLTHLTLSRCTALITLQGVHAPPFLQYFDCIGCTALTALRDMSALFSLANVNCSQCTALVSLGKLPPALTDLDCSFCTALTVLGKLPMTLEYLNCNQCPALQALPALPTGLRELLCSCAQVPALPASLLHFGYWGYGPVLLTHLPVGLSYLYCDKSTALPEAYRPHTRLNYYDCDASDGLWRQIVHRRHTDDRQRAAVMLLPAAALLYV